MMMMVMVVIILVVVVLSHQDVAISWCEQTAGACMSEKEIPL